MTVHSPGPIIWTFNDLTIYLRASLFFVTFGVRQNRSKTRMVKFTVDMCVNDFLGYFLHKYYT